MPKRCCNPVLIHLRAISLVAQIISLSPLTPRALYDSDWGHRWPGHNIAWRGVRNVLRHLGALLDEPPTTRAALNLPPTNIVFADEYIYSPLRGFWETAVDPGDQVRECSCTRLTKSPVTQRASRAANVRSPAELAGD